uniref:Uncharacterized protein n=1 Tax=uncultured marine virus TaxID=186617 RepID=A0A0F7L881_9VIRU|nr:hypothetical protein [uncultured marine virus]
MHLLNKWNTICCHFSNSILICCIAFSIFNNFCFSLIFCLLYVVTCTCINSTITHCCRFISQTIKSITSVFK